MALVFCLLSSVLIWDATQECVTADTVELSSGARVSGHIVEVTESTVRVALRQGGEIVFRRSDVVSIRTDDAAEPLAGPGTAATPSRIRTDVHDTHESVPTRRPAGNAAQPRVPVRVFTQSDDVQSDVRSGSGRRGQLRRFPENPQR